MNTCPICNEAFAEVFHIHETLVGFFSPTGHDHNNNCLGATFHCPSRHETHLWLRRKCFACDWKGKENCWCHEEENVYPWPEIFEAEYRRLFLARPK